MNARNLFRVTAALLMLTGLYWLLAPKATVASYDPNVDPYTVYLVQILGTFNIALAVLAFSASRMAPSTERQAVMTTLIVQQALSLVVNLLAVFGGVIPGGMGWFVVAFNIVFILAFSYFRFLRPEAEPVPKLQS
ncbi:MAG: hypothetical protein R3293_13975 [Candidatus Promineifilaceae bacterium]|nr:hypothetical protein [Candidatus Promineifilaceae bacterium]